MPRRRVVAIDGNSLIYRAFFALPASIATSDGFPTNSLYGFTSMLLKLMADLQPDLIVVALDAAKKTFRNELYAEYKAHRPSMPDDLAVQLPEFDCLFSAFGIPVFREEGWEADDLLGSIAEAGRKAGDDVVLVTGDRDAFQLVGDGVTVMATVRGITDTVIYDEAAVRERYGIGPESVPDMVGLRGDTSDNIPGVPGIGEKTAAELIRRYGTLENLCEHLDELTPKKRALFEEHRELAFLSRQLAVISRDAPFDASKLEEGNQPDAEAVHALFDRFQFNSLRSRLEAVLGPGGARPEEPTITLSGEALPEGEAARLLDEARKVTAAVAFSEADGAPRLFISLDDGPVSSLPCGPGSAAAAYLADPEAGKAVPDAKELYRAAGRTGLEAGGIVFDLGLAAYLLDSGRREYSPPAVLAALGLPPHAGDMPAAALDAAAVRAGWKLLETALGERGQLSLLTECEIPLARVLAGMEDRGVAIDGAVLGEAAARMGDRLDELTALICRYAGREFNINSPRQLADVLFDGLGLTPGQKTKGGSARSTSVDVLVRIKEEHEIVPLILEYRMLSKLKGTYLDALPQLIGPDGRLHTTFNQKGTATGRLSSSEPNLQNIPVRTEDGRAIRKAFVPSESEGCILSADYSQIELRILAHLSGDEELLEAFRKGEDIHAATAAEVFGLPLDEVPKGKRQAAKAINFGIVYGLSAYGLSEQLGIERGEAAGYIERYFEKFGAVKRFIDATISRAAGEGFVLTMLNRRRDIPELASRDPRLRSLGERLAVNSVIQGSAADMIKLAMIRVDEGIRGAGLRSRMVLQVHDELIVDVSAGELEAVRRAVVPAMEEALPMSVPVVVDVEWGASWFDA